METPVISLLAKALAYVVVIVLAASGGYSLAAYLTNDWSAALGFLIAVVAFGVVIYACYRLIVLGLSTFTPQGEEK